MYNIIIFLICLALQANSKETIDTTIINKDTTFVYKTIFDNGQIKSIARYTNWKLNGKQEEFYENGQISKISYYEMDCPKDSILSYSLQGKVLLIGYYKNCQENGISIKMNEDGDTLFYGNYKLGKSIGIHKVFYSKGNIASIICYNQHGQKHGLSQTWREDGTRKDSTIFNNGNTIEERTYYLNGKPRYLEKYKGQDIALENTFSDGSTLGKIQNPLIEGTYYEYLTGKVVSKVVNGSGKAFYYNENGTSPDTCKYKNGILVESKVVK